jgi:predicted CoA-binding protein
VSREARTIAEAAGMDYVEDACTAIVHRQLRTLKKVTGEPEAPP